MDDSVIAYKERRKKRIDEREFRESDVMRDKSGKFTSKGSSKVPEKIQAILDKSYYSRSDKIDGISKVLGRMSIGTKFNYTDDRGVTQIFEKVDKGDDGWEMRSKTKNGYGPVQRVKRGFIAAHMLER
jgi:hypothetical protein